MHGERAQPKVVGRLEFGDNFLDVRGPPIAARAAKLDGRLPIGDQRDEIVVGEPDDLALIERGDEVLPLLVDLDAAGRHQIFRRHRNAFLVVDAQHAVV